MCKKILHRLLQGRTFSGTFEKLEELFARCSWLINSLPLGVRTYTDSDFSLLCPNDVLLGKVARSILPPPGLEDLEDVSLQGALCHMEMAARLFFRVIVRETFGEMIPRQKWRWQERNLVVGDVGFISYPSKFSRPWFRQWWTLTRTWRGLLGQLRWALGPGGGGSCRKGVCR